MQTNIHAHILCGTVSIKEKSVSGKFSRHYNKQPTQKDEGGGRRETGKAETFIFSLLINEMYVPRRVFTYVCCSG